MESKVKSHISNKTYSTKLDTIEDGDKDLKTELYMLPISGHKLMVAPGKSMMSENGIAFCYVYVIQREKVVTKLGVYEKKSDSMPLIFDISTFPEGSFCLFEEFEKNPSKLVEFEMKEESSAHTVFDFLIAEFPKLEEKKKTLKDAYRALYELMKKDENKKDKDMKPILKVISDASKEDSPTDAFLYTLKDSVNNEKSFVSTLIALQYVFKIGFRLKTDNGFYQDMMTRWAIQDALRTVEVDIETYEIIESKEPEAEPKPEVSELDLDVSLPKEETTEVSDKDVSVSEFKEEPEDETEKAPNISLDETPKAVDLDDTSMKVLTPIPESKEISETVPEVKKVRKTRTPKSDTKPKEETKPKETIPKESIPMESIPMEETKPKESKAKTKTKTEPKKEESMSTPLGTSLNVVPKSTIKVPSSKKIRMKSAVEKEN